MNLPSSISKSKLTMLYQNGWFMVVQENALKVQCLGFSVASSGEGADCNHLVSPFPCKCVGETTVAVKLAKNVTKNFYTLDL